MSETDQSSAQKQDALTWEGLQTFRDLPDGMIAARRARFEALELFILILHAWTKIKARELNDIMFVLEHFLPAYKILKLQ